MASQKYSQCPHTFKTAWLFFLYAIVGCYLSHTCTAFQPPSSGLLSRRWSARESVPSEVSSVDNAPPTEPVPSTKPTEPVPSANSLAEPAVPSFLAAWTPPVLPDLSALGGSVSSAAEGANSTLIGLLQVAQAAMNPRSVTRTFSRQFSKRYLSRWNDKTGLKELVEQTLADLVRVADTIDVHSNPRVAAFAARVRTQIETLRRDHDARVIFFFNEEPDIVKEIPILPACPFKALSPHDSDQEDEEEVLDPAPLFSPRRVAPGAGVVKKKHGVVRLFKNLLTLAQHTEPVPEEEDMSWFEAPSSAPDPAVGPAGFEGTMSTSPIAPLPGSGPMAGAGQSGVDRLLQQVRERMETKAAEERKSEEAVVKAGLRLEFERWQLLEASRYFSETWAKTRELLMQGGGSASRNNQDGDGAGETDVGAGPSIAAAAETAASIAMEMVPPQLRALFQEVEGAVAKGMPVKLDLQAWASIVNNVRIGHRVEPFPQRDWRSSLDLLVSQTPLPDPLLRELNHPLYLHSSLLLATTPYNVALTKAAETDPALLARTALVASKALGVAPSRLQVHHVVSDKACAVVVVVPDKRTTYVIFRGTKDPVDVLTDINFLSAPFTPLGWEEEGAGGEREEEKERGSAVGFLPFIDPTNAAQEQLQLMAGTDDATGTLKVHGGFKLAFDSIKQRVTELLLDEDGAGSATDSVVFVGHSMGGALAQLATVYFCELRARLVTFASPAIGNAAFCRLLDCCGQPYGGLRVWNDFDVVPSIAQLVGYRHAGVPIKLDVSKSAKELFEEENVNSLRGLIDFLAPHVMFQLGSVCFVFPVIGWDLQSGGTALRQRLAAEQQLDSDDFRRENILSGTSLGKESMS